MGTPILEVKNLRVSIKTFEGEAKILNGVNLRVNEKEVVALVGESGCGKSLTLKTIIRTLPIPPARIVDGEIIFKGKNILEMTEKEFQRMRGEEISMIPQSVMSYFNPTISIGNHLGDLIVYRDKQEMGLFGLLRGVPKNQRERAEAKAKKTLKDVVMPSPEKVLKNYPFQLSGGMGQRVLIGMALIRNPFLVLADEPGTALDVSTYNVIIQLIEDKIREHELSVVYVTHNLAVARRISQRVYIMYAGSIVEVARTDMIFRNPQHPYTVGLVRAIPTLLKTKISGIRGRIPDYKNPPSGCRFHPRCDFAMEICKRKVPGSTIINDEHTVFCHRFNGNH